MLLVSNAPQELNPNNRGCQPTDWDGVSPTALQGLNKVIIHKNAKRDIQPFQGCC